MGKRHLYQCSGCGYEVATAAGPAFGFISQTDTFVCTGCKIVQDVVTGRRGESIPGQFRGSFEAVASLPKVSHWRKSQRLGYNAYPLPQVR